MPLSNAAPQELIKSCRDCKVGPFRPVMINSNLHDLTARPPVASVSFGTQRRSNPSKRLSV